jgi:hypothetical protein
MILDHYCVWRVSIRLAKQRIKGGDAIATHDEDGEPRWTVIIAKRFFAFENRPNCKRTSRRTRICKRVAREARSDVGLPSVGCQLRFFKGNNLQRSIAFRMAYVIFIAELLLKVSGGFSII